MPHPDTWLKPLPQGLYCEPGGFFIDPSRVVDRAVITHAHSDHARPGHKAVLATAATLALMRARMGPTRAGHTQLSLTYGETITIGDVRVWLQPAGHVLGSAQVAMEYRGSRAVVSGDYKRVPDPTCDPFEPIACDVFVTEAASGWMRIRQRAKSSGAELPLIISDHADWNELNRTIDDTGAPEVWVTHGWEAPLIHAAAQRGIRGRALRMVGYGDEDAPDQEAV